MQDKTKINICFLFASTGIGGAERSMSRLMEMMHPDRALCHVVFVGTQNEAFCGLLDTLGISFTHVRTYDWIKLAHAFREHQTDVAYLFGNLRIIPWAWIARLSRVPVIVAAERSIPVSRLKIYGRWLEHHFIDGYICNSEKARQILHNLCRVPKPIIYVIYNGICADTYSLITKLPSNEPQLICVANIQPQKGHIILFETVKKLQDKYPMMQLNLVGSDYSNGAFFVKTEGLGLKGHYTWLDYVPDVIPYLQKADIFVLPSLEREGTPTSILEAMLVGLPVVASDVGGVPELVQDGLTGFVVKSGSANALADSLDQLLSSPDLRRKMGLAGRTHVLTHHTIEKMVENHLQVFQKLLKESLS